MKKGFSFISVLIVIVLIIVAITVPLHRAMENRARIIKISADFNMLSMALELYKRDWGQYPKMPSLKEITKKSSVYQELAGMPYATVNSAGAFTLTGKEGPIVYVGSKVLDDMRNPYYPDEHYYYKSSQSGDFWALFCRISKKKYIYITSKSAFLKETEDPSSVGR